VERTLYEATGPSAFVNVEPEHRLVARTLESQWEADKAKLAALAEAETVLVTARAVKPPVPDREALRLGRRSTTAVECADDEPAGTVNGDCAR
jgi:hypothetical protein